jgi:signal transduction histidine kinase
VEDDGPGFAADLLPRVFQRFVKGRESEGHGLGLAFVSAVAGAHTGRAVARNRSPRGAEIVVELPMATAHQEERQIPDNLLTSH